MLLDTIGKHIFAWTKHLVMPEASFVVIATKLKLPFSYKTKI